MIKSNASIIGLFLMLFSVGTFATHCPDPQTTSLQWGEPPFPWVVDPFSSGSPQADTQTQFVRANILVAGYGRGIVCTYKTSLNEYSIWWEVLTKIPSRDDYTWINSPGGFLCSVGLLDCQFYTAENGQNAQQEPVNTQAPQNKM